MAGELFIIIVVLITGIIGASKLPKTTSDKFKDYDERLRWGPVNPKYICPHCQTKGFIRIMSVKKKRGISGAKATGAVLTGGISILITGLSRKENFTQAHCGICNSTWNF